MNTRSITKVILVIALCAPYAAQAEVKSGFGGTTSRGGDRVFVPCQSYCQQPQQGIQSQPQGQQARTEPAPSSLKNAQACDVYKAEGDLKAARLKVKRIIENGESVVIVSKRRFDMDTIERVMTGLAIGAIIGAIAGIGGTYKVIRFLGLNFSK